jgi:hypothetical protein
MVTCVAYSTGVTVLFYWGVGIPAAPGPQL